MLDVGKWEGASSPLQLSGWAVTTIDVGLTTRGRPLRTFHVVRTAGPRMPSRCGDGCTSSRFRLNGREGKTSGLRIADVPGYGGATQWVIHRTRLVCRDCGAARFEVLPRYIETTTRMTARLHRFIRHQAAMRPYLNVADETGISEFSVRNVVFDDYDPEKLARRHPKRGPKIDRLPAPRYLGLDEITLVDRKDPDRAHLREARAVLVDLESGNVLALLDDVRAETIAGWFATLSKTDRARLRGVTIDMSRSYRTVLAKALKAKPAKLDDAESAAWDVILSRPVPVIVDRFHVEARAQAIANTVRVAEVRAAARRARSPDWRKRDNDDDVRLFARMLRSRRLPRTPERREKLRAYLKAHPLTYAAYQARQDFRTIYETASSSVEAGARFAGWERDLDPRMARAFAPVLASLRAFRTEILAYFDLRITNGPTESANATMRRVVRVGPNILVETLRAKMLARGRLRPVTSFFCDGCGVRSMRGAAHEGRDDDLRCGSCLNAPAGTAALRRRPAPPTLRDLFDLEERDAMRRVLSRRQQVARRGEQMRFAFDVVQAEAEEALDPLPWGRAA